MIIWIFVLYILAENSIRIPAWIFYASWIMLWLKMANWVIKAVEWYGKCRNHG